MNIYDKRQYFINECKQYRYLNKKLSEYKYSIKNQKDINDVDCIICEIGRIKSRIDYVDEVLSKINEEIKVLIIDLWIKGHSKVKVSIDHKIDDSMIYKKINKNLDEILKDCH